MARLDSDGNVLWAHPLKVEEGTNVHGLSLSADGSRLAVALGKGGAIDIGAVLVYETANPPRWLSSWQGLNSAALTVAVHPHGGYVAVGTRGGRIFKLKLDPLELQGRYLIAKPREESEGLATRLGLAREAHVGFVYGLAFSADGERLYSVSKKGRDSRYNELKVWNAESRAELRQALVPSQPTGVEVSRDGELLVLSTDQGAEVWLAR